MKKFLFSNVPHKIVSVLIALLLWQMVLILDDPERGPTMEIPIEYVDESPNLIRVHAPESISIEVRYLTQPVRILPADISVRVSLRNAQPGRETYRVEIIPSPRIRSDVRLIPETNDVLVEIDPAEEKQIRIDPRQNIRYTGLRSGIELAGASTDPDVVTVRGASRYVNQAVRAQITVDLSKMENAGVYETEVQILDNEGNPIPNTRVRVTPERIQFRPNLRAEPVRVLLLHPVVRGTPAPGYRVVSYDLIPAEIRGRGESALLAGLSTIETEPIDISGISEDRVFTVRYVLPEGVTRDPSSPETVQFRVRVVREANSDQ